MVEVRREGDRVVFEVIGLHKLWALKSRLEIPCTAIRSARRDPAVVRGWMGWRGAGTYVPGLIAAGTFHLEGRRIFRDVSDPERAIVVELDDQDYSELVIEVADPAAAIALLNSGAP